MRRELEGVVDARGVLCERRTKVVEDKQHRIGEWVQLVAPLHTVGSTALIPQPWSNTASKRALANESE